MSDIKSSLRFQNYIVEKIEFNTNFQFSGEEKKIDFDLDNDCSFEEDNLILGLDMTIFPDAVVNDYPFTLRVKLIGLFEVESGLDQKTKEDFAEKNAIAILFPYLRALTSVYSANANVGTLILPPINVVKYLRDKKATKSEKEKVKKEGTE